MVEKVDIEIYRGQTYQRHFIISGFDYDISKIYFTVKEATDSKNIVLQKKLNDGIDIVDVDEETGAKTYSLLISSDDTENLKTNYNYGYDITIRAGESNYIKTPIVMGKFKVLPVYTTKKEETNE